MSSVAAELLALVGEEEEAMVEVAAAVMVLSLLEAVFVSFPGAVLLVVVVGEGEEVVVVVAGVAEGAEVVVVAVVADGFVLVVHSLLVAEGLLSQYMSTQRYRYPVREISIRGSFLYNLVDLE